MQGSIIRIKTSDDIELQGIVCEPVGQTARIAVIHIHGTEGNFYENAFVDHFAETYPRMGVAFFSFNNRGHDGGSIYESFSDSIHDIRAVVGLAKSRGCEEVVLQGHSLGALKAVYYSTTTSGSPRALILLSPVDIVDFYLSTSRTDREQVMRRLAELAENDPTQLVPETIWGEWLMSVETFTQMVAPGSEADIFPFRTTTLRGSIFREVDAPTFVAIGGDDFALAPSPEKAIAQFDEFENVDTAFIEGAPHNFAGYEEALVEQVVSWLARGIEPSA